MSGLINSNAFTVIEGRPVTSSLKVAEYFGRQHFHVLRDIENLIEKRPDLRKSNFGLTEKISKLGATTRKVPFYWMDRKGFCILAMGFTGAKALDFKIAFYDEFERMEKALHPVTECPLALAYLTEEHAYQIMAAVARRAKSVGAHYQTIYRALKARYQVTKYTHIRDADFEDAMRFIQTVDLRVPTAPESPFDETGRCKLCGLQPLPKDCIVLTPLDINRLMNWIYCWRYLFRESLELFDQFLHAVGSPYSAQFHEMIVDSWMGFMESMLRKNGYEIRAMKCYQAFIANK